MKFNSGISAGRSSATVPGNLPHRPLLSPVLSRFRVLFSEATGIETIAPGGHEFNFTKPLVFIHGPNSCGKTRFTQMLRESVLNDRYFRQYGCSWFMGQIENYARIHRGLLSPKTDKASLRSFLYNYQHDCAFLRYLDEVKPGTGSSFNLKQGISPAVFRKLIKSLSEDTPLNRFFYMQLSRQDQAEIFPLFQKAISSDRPDMRNERGGSEAGSFDRKLRKAEGLAVDIDSSEIRSMLGVSNPAQMLTDEQFVKLTSMRNKAFSSGGYALLEWEITKYSIHSILKNQKLLLADSSRSAKAQKDPASLTFATDTRLLVFLDEATTFMEPNNVNSFCSDLKELLEIYPGRIQFFLCSHSQTVARYFEGVADYLNCYRRPAEVLDCFRCS